MLEKQKLDLSHRALPHAKTRATLKSRERLKAPIRRGVSESPNIPFLVIIAKEL